MNLNYEGIKHNLSSVRAEIDNLMNYIENNQSKLDRRFVEIEIHTRLANISTNVLQLDSQQLVEPENRIL